MDIKTARVDQLTKRCFLIIAGTSKAGTTSVFNYLAGHPQIRACEGKETRFFLDLDYPLPSKLRYQRDSLPAYLSLFGSARKAGEKAWSLEATPDYLYSRGTPNAIRKALPNTWFLFILREPVSRLLSFYRFGQQLNQISPAMTFDDYIERQKKNTASDLPCHEAHPVFRALAHGHYSFYLNRYLELFGKTALYIAFYEDLRRDAQAFITATCRWVGIDESYFCNHQYEITNKSYKARNPWLHRIFFEGRQRSRQLVRNQAQLRSVLRKIAKPVNQLYWKMNATEWEKAEISNSTRQFLFDYYREEPQRLKQMFGIDPPWPEYHGQTPSQAKPSASRV